MFAVLTQRHRAQKFPDENRERTVIKIK